MKRLLFGISVFMLAGLGTAQAVPLQDLFNGAELVVVDKRFFDWVLIDEVATGDLPDYDSIEVTGLADDPDNPGIHFETNGQMAVEDFDFLDVLFGFSVQVLDPEQRIKDNSLEITGFSFEGEGGVVTIIEEVFDATGVLIGEKFVEADILDDPDYDNLFDSAEFERQRSLRVEKNILVFADPGGFASLDSFEQRFSQVPEPSALLLIGGLLPLAAGAARRRRQRKA